MQLHIRDPIVTAQFLDFIEEHADGAASYCRAETAVGTFWMESGLNWRNGRDPVFEVASALDAVWPVVDAATVVRQVQLVAGYTALCTAWERNSRERSYRFWKRRPNLAQDECERIRRQAEQDEKRACAALLRDIFGNPFRPVSVDPSWLTSDVVALARSTYDERAFDRMPILADALQDAGCTNNAVLTHCRDANPVHVRGCWVVDLLLGKE
jgi:hypothetical protein